LKRERCIALVGDATNPKTFGGIPFYLIQAGRDNNLPYVGLPLKPPQNLQIERALWNVAQLVTTGKRGGYQYSEIAMERLWAQLGSLSDSAQILSLFQMLPNSIWRRKNIRRWFYIDATLSQLFQHYGVADNYSRAIASNAIKRERAGYERADGLICHSAWVADSLIQEYKIEPKKIHVVVPGANINEGLFRSWSPPRRQENGRLNLVFVGRAWRRKGLDRLLAAMARDDLDGRVTLRVIGCDEHDVDERFRGVKGVEWHGLIDKSKDEKAFLDLIASADIGCLISRAECGGFSLREFAAVGLGLIAPDVGGSPEHCPADSAVLVKPSDSPDDIANILLRLVENPDEVEALRAASTAAAQTLLWSYSIAKLEAIIAD